MACLLTTYRALHQHATAAAMTVITSQYNWGPQGLSPHVQRVDIGIGSEASMPKVCRHVSIRPICDYSIVYHFIPNPWALMCHDDGLTWWWRWGQGSMSDSSSTSKWKIFSLWLCAQGHCHVPDQEAHWPVNCRTKLRWEPKLHMSTIKFCYSQFSLYWTFHINS